MLDFTYQGYSKLLDYLRQKGFEFSPYSNNLIDKLIFLRHDIDFSLEDALTFAKLENELGVQSTFFLQLGSPFYNLLNIESRKIISQIIELGHDIGLHFDTVNYKYFSYNDLLTKINYEIGVLESIIGKEVVLYSFHRPASNPTIHDQLLFDERYVHSRKFDSKKYISDSKMHFREDLISYIENDAFNSYQINLHPIWYKNNNNDIEHRLLDFLIRTEKKTIELIQKNTDGFHFNNLKR